MIPVDSVWPSEAIRWLRSGSTLAQEMTFFDGTKPLPEPILTNHQWGLVAFTNGSRAHFNVIYVFNTMATDDLAAQGSKASAAMLLILYPWNSLALAWKGLTPVTKERDLFHKHKPLSMFLELEALNIWSRTWIRYDNTVKPLTSSHPKCCVKVASQKGWPLMRGGHCAIIGTHVLVCVGRYAWFCVM